MQMAYWAVIVAGGQGVRAGAEKQFSLLAGRAVLWHAVLPFVNHPAIEHVRVVVAPDKSESAAQAVDNSEVEILPSGGATRAKTVRAGIADIDDGDWVIIHDAARPCLSDAALARLYDAAVNDDVGGILALPVHEALKEADEAKLRTCQTLVRKGKYLAQTPQMFRAGMLKHALAKAGDVEDEAQAMEQAGHAPLLVEGEAANIKITHPADFALAEAILQHRAAVRSGAK